MSTSMSPIANKLALCHSSAESMAHGQHRSTRTDTCLGLRKDDSRLAAMWCADRLCRARRYGLKHKRRRGLKKGTTHPDRRAESGAARLNTKSLQCVTRLRHVAACEHASTDHWPSHCAMTWRFGPPQTRLLRRSFHRWRRTPLKRGCVPRTKSSASKVPQNVIHSPGCNDADVVMNDFSDIDVS